MAENEKAEATLGGKHLVFDSRPIQWSLTVGVDPNIASFDMKPQDADALFQTIGSPIDLIINPVKGNKLTVSNLWVLAVEPGPNKWISRIKVADRRWFWNRKHIIRRYNMRRNIGNKRILAHDQALEIDFDRAPDVAYWNWSLKDGIEKWKPIDILSDIFSEVSRIELDYWGSSFGNPIIDSRVVKRDLPIEELSIDDAGDSAIAKALQALPEAGVTIDYDGSVVIFSKAAADEIQTITTMGSEIFGMGHVALVKNSILRPKEIHVLFTREVEVRHDYKEVATAVGATVTTNDPPGDKRTMENVLPVPDYATDGLSGRPSQIRKRTLPQGAWVNIDDYLRALPSIALEGVTYQVDHKMIQRAFIPQMDLWGPLGMTGDVPDKNGNIVNWPGRISAFQTHYRQTFRLDSKWMDRSLSIRAYRLSTIDPSSGQRGPSMAYGDYCILPSQRARWRNHALGKRFDYVINKSGYPTGANEYLDSTALPSPGIVSILDQDQGIVRVDYVMDQVKSYDMVIPSQVDSSSAATSDITIRNRPIAFNAYSNEAQVPTTLSPSFKLAIIITHVPASPNDSQQLHRIVVKPTEVKGLLSGGSRNGLEDSNGPIMEVRIGAAIEVARIRWKDDKSDDIETIFGLKTIGADPKSQMAFSRRVDDLCINIGSTKGKGGGSLNEIALAQAASIYATLTDRFEGSMAAPMNGQAKMKGWISEISHEYLRTGETITRISLPSHVPAMSLFSFLSKNERAVILKLVQP